MFKINQSSLLTTTSLVLAVEVMLFSGTAIAHGRDHNACRIVVSSSSQLNDSITNQACENKVIILLPGVYKPTAAVDAADVEPRNKTFAIKYNMKLMGFGHFTKLSGERGNPSLAEDNIRHVVTINNLSNVTLSLMTIQGGYEERYNPPANHEIQGAGVIAQFSKLTLNRVVVLDNYCRGGAVAGQGTDLVVKKSIFKNNVGFLQGGAISVGDNDGLNSGEGSLLVSDSVFVDNTSGSLGGAIEAYRLDSTIRDSYFSGNTAVYLGGAISLFAGGYQELHNTIEGNIFKNNSAVLGGAIGLANQATTTINRNEFINNTATGEFGTHAGGAIVMFGSYVEQMDGNYFDSNSSILPEAAQHIQCLSSAVIADDITDNVFINPGISPYGVLCSF